MINEWSTYDELIGPYKEARKALRQVDNKLAEAIEKMNIRRGLDFNNLFDEFLDLALCLLCNNPSQRQIELWNKAKADKEYVKAFIEAMTAYGEAAEGYHDPLGDAFMSRISHGNMGQFFTPEALCEIMAQITHLEDGKVDDPTCGAGRMLLEALKVARKEGKEPWLYGEDISLTCCKMATLNLLINNARGLIRCGDQLITDFQNEIHFQIERVFTPNGECLSTYWQYVWRDYGKMRPKILDWDLGLLEKGLWPEPPLLPWEHPVVVDAVEPRTVPAREPVKADTAVPQPINPTLRGQLSLF